MTFKTDDAYSAGYAIPAFPSTDKYDYWHFRNEIYKTPKEIDRHYRPEWPAGMAKIEDVRRMAIK